MSRNYQWKIVSSKKGEKSLAETFPKLVELIHDKDTKVVLSFGAGGLRFFAHASMMKFLSAVKATPLIDEVWGCSGGAFSAYAYAMGVTPEDIEQKGYDLYHERCDLRFASSRLAAAKMRIMDTIFPASPNLLREYALFQITMRNALLQLIEGKQLEKPFYCTAYNVNAEHNDVLTPTQPLPERYKDFVMHADPIDSIIASSAIPVVFVPKAIRKGVHKEQYIDGSIAENIPLLPVYRKWEIDKEIGMEKRGKLLIIAINTFPKVAERPFFKRRFVKRMPFVDILRFGLELFDLVMNIRFDEEFESLSQDQRVKVVKINLPLKTPMLLNCKAIPTIIHNAQTDLMDELLKVEGSL
jgi:predicted acylesterase/phospholipase RssA